MGQAIAGVAPETESETVIMETWPTLGAHGFGRVCGRLYQGGLGRLKLFGVPLAALLSVPFVLPLYFHMLVPRLPFVLWGWPNAACRKYRLTNRRVVVVQAFGGGTDVLVRIPPVDEDADLPTVGRQIQTGLREQDPSATLEQTSQITAEVGEDLMELEF